MNFEELKKYVKENKLDEALKIFADFVESSSFELNNNTKELLKKIIHELLDGEIEIKSSYQLYLIRAKAFEKLNNLEESLLDYHEALKRTKKDWKIYNSIGNIYFKLSSFLEAKKYFDLALEISPETYLLLKNKAIVEYSLKNYDAAISSWNKLISLKKDASNYLFRGHCYYYLNKYPEALLDYAKVISINPNEARAHLAKGNVYYFLKQYDRAIDSYENGLKVDKNNALLYRNLALVYRQLKDFDRSIFYADKAIEINPNLSTAYNDRGVSRIEKGLFKEAIQDFQQSILIDKDLHITYIHLAEAFKKEKSYDEARKIYEDLKRLVTDEKNYFYQEALLKINEIDKIKQDENYAKLEELVEKIKQTLLYEGDALSHYTSLTNLSSLILKGGDFKLSEATYLNDTSEGKPLFSFLGLKENNNIQFIKKPFIGSFVPSNKADDLALWRMYGKENHIEAQGCSFTIDASKFLQNLKSKILYQESDFHSNKSSNHESSNSLNITLDNLFYYCVAYFNMEENKFVIPNYPAKATELNEVICELKDLIAKPNSNKHDEFYINVNNKLTEIAYLFKGFEYQYENEVRLVVEETGFEPKINLARTPPNIYINTTPITDFLTEIIFGPKIERAEEWTTTFNYALNKDNLKCKIKKSSIPFK
ncbi:MAG TPA: tetratricopeptide repeat protein [Bacteroidia bacterium]|nr:tetratricopeptide repeat protein [Bacteroidia bacterium]